MQVNILQTGRGICTLIVLLLISLNIAKAESVSSTADHSKFKELQKEFKNGPEVTKACLTCHTEASKQLMQTDCVFVVLEGRIAKHRTQEI